MVYYTNPANEHGKFNVACATNILQDVDLKLLKYFRTPVLETQNKTWSIKLQEKAGDVKIMFLDKCIFLANIQNVNQL